MADYSLGLYEKAMPGDLSWEQMLRCAAEGGFDALEISIDESDGRLGRLHWDAAQRRALRNLSQDAGIPIKTMCLSGHRRFPLGSHDPAIRERSLEILRSAVDLSGDLGIRLIQLAGYDVYYEETDEDTRKYLGDNLRKCVEYAAKQGVILGFETMETPFMDTVTKAMDWVRQVDSPYLGVYPDIGNLQNAAVLYGTDLASNIAAGQGHIFAAHLKETCPGIYRDMDFGTGHTNYDAAISALWAQGVRHFTGEFWHQKGRDYKASVRAASCFLRQRIETVIAQGERHA